MKYILIALLFLSTNAKAQDLHKRGGDTITAIFRTVDENTQKSKWQSGYKVVSCRYFMHINVKCEEVIMKFLDRRKKPFPKSTLIVEVK